MPIASVQLNIETQPIKLQFHTQAATCPLTTNPHQFQIDTEAAKVEITSRPYGTLEIDQSPCRASYGLYDHTEFLIRMADLGRQTALETIGRLAEEGDRMASIETREPVFANMAAESSIVPAPEITVASIASPNIRYTPNAPKFNPIPGSVNISFERGSVQGDYQPGRVEGAVTQYPSIRFSTTGNNLDIET